VLVYLSYSRQEAEAPARALRERLVARFGMESVWDGTIGAGDAWLDEIRRAVQRCRVMVVFVGPGVFADSTWRIEEVRYALVTGKVVIPVLVNDARPPSANELPPALHDLALRQAFVLRAEQDLDLLVDLVATTLHGAASSAAQATPGGFTQ
jgi:hypothetical protein